MHSFENGNAVALLPYAPDYIAALPPYVPGNTADYEFCALLDAPDYIFDHTVALLPYAPDYIAALLPYDPGNIGNLACDPISKALVAGSIWPVLCSNLFSMLCIILFGQRSRILEELKKCQLLCHDCHVEKTRAEGGYPGRGHKRARIPIPDKEQSNSLVKGFLAVFTLIVYDFNTETPAYL